MKKLLLGSLLVLGATSFAAVTGTSEKATLPVKVKGNVVDKTSDALVITPLKNGGVDGASFEFDFGDLVQGDSQTLDGGFSVTRVNASALSADATKIAIGILNAAGDGVDAEVVNVLDRNVTIAYAVGHTLNSDKTEATASLSVTATAAKTEEDETTDATAGLFSDTSKSVAVIVTPPTAAE